MTAKYRIEYKPRAAKAIKKLQKLDQQRIMVSISELALAPRPPDMKKLVGGTGEYRIRVGNYRVIYEVNDGVLVVLVLSVGHRRDIYR